MIKATLTFILVTLQHKWFVLVAGLKFRVPFFRLLTHDLSKFSRSELPGFARHFYNGNGDPEGFAKTMLHHYNTNPHHWEHWIDRKTNLPLEMDDVSIREMVADWFAATRTYTGAYPVSFETWKWYKLAYSSVRLHPNTERKVKVLLEATLKK